MVGAAPTGDAPTTSEWSTFFFAYSGVSYIRGLTKVPTVPTSFRVTLPTLRQSGMTAKRDSDMTHRAQCIYKSLLAQLTNSDRFQNGLSRIYKKFLPKSTCPTHWFTCPKLSVNGIFWALNTEEGIGLIPLHWNRIILILMQFSSKSKHFCFSVTTDNVNKTK